MAITKLSELQTAIADRLARSDFTAAQTLECINLAESMMNREMRAVDMETKTDPFSITGQYVSTPTGFVAVRAFYLTANGTTRTLRAMSPEQIFSQWSSGTDVPKAYAVVGGNFLFGPTPGATYSAVLTYYKALVNLAAANDTNWMLTANPDAYLYGSLYQAAARLQQAELAQGYLLLYSQAMDGVRKASAAKKYSGTSMAISPG